MFGTAVRLAAMLLLAVSGLNILHTLSRGAPAPGGLPSGFRARLQDFLPAQAYLLAYTHTHAYTHNPSFSSFLTNRQHISSHPTSSACAVWGFGSVCLC